MQPQGWYTADSQPFHGAQVRMSGVVSESGIISCGLITKLTVLSKAAGAGVGGHAVLANLKGQQTAER